MTELPPEIRYRQVERDGMIYVEDDSDPGAWDAVLAMCCPTCGGMCCPTCGGTKEEPRPVWDGQAWIDMPTTVPCTDTFHDKGGPMSDLGAIRTLVSQGNPLTADEGAYLLAERDALREELERLRLEHEGGDEHHKGCARELAFMSEVASTWKSDAQRLREENERLREALERAFDALPQTGMRTVRAILRAALSEKGET